MSHNPHADTKHDGEHSAKHEPAAKHEGAKEETATNTSRAVDIGAWVALGLGLGAGTLALVQRLSRHTEGEQATRKRKRNGGD